MLDRKIAPEFNKNFDFALIEPEIVALPNGTTLYFIRGGQQDVIRIEVVMQAGRWYEQVRGSSYFTANLLSKGTHTKSSYAIASGFDAVGAHLEVSPGLDTVSIALYSLASKLHKALPLLLEIMQEAIFPEKELEQLKTIFSQNMKVNKEKTSFLSSQLFKKVLFGESHPYGSELDDSSLTTLTTDELKSFKQEFFNQFQIFVAGKIDDENKNLIVDAFGYTKKTAAHKQLHTPQPSSGLTHYETKLDSLQTSLRVGKRTIGRDHNDYPKLLLTNHILGGYFGSRLMKNIREKKGLTYGIHSSIHALQHDSYMAIGTDVNRENKSLALAEIQKELADLRTNLVDTQELDTARFHFIGSLQSDLATAFAHAEKIKTIVTHNLPKEYYQIIIQQLRDATNVELREIANRYFDETELIEVAVG